MENQMSLKQRIETALYQPCGFRYNHPDWDKKLWNNKSAVDIKEYLLNRFHTTLDIEEYYGSMILLYHTIPNKELLIEFKDSIQYQNRESYSKGSFETLNSIEQNSTELNIIEGSMIKMIGDD
jgi:hypothetical protein